MSIMVPSWLFMTLWKWWDIRVTWHAPSAEINQGDTLPSCFNITAVNTENLLYFVEGFCFCTVQGIQVREQWLELDMEQQTGSK